MVRLFVLLLMCVAGLQTQILSQPSIEIAAATASTTYSYDSGSQLSTGAHLESITAAPTNRDRRPSATMSGDSPRAMGHCVAAEAGTAAAEGADAAAVDVGHAGIHQFPGITAGKSQFFDGADLGELSNTGDLAGYVQKNGNIRYVLRGSGDVGVDRTTGLPTDIYTVIRKPDGSVLTMFPGTSPMS